MKKEVEAFIAVAGIVFCLIGCDKVVAGINGERTRIEAEQRKIEIGKAQFRQEVSAYIAEAQIVLDANEKIVSRCRSVESLKEEKDETGFNAELDKLDDRNKILQIKLNRYKEKEKDEWDLFRMEFDSDLTELGKAFAALTIFRP